MSVVRGSSRRGGSSVELSAEFPLWAWFVFGAALSWGILGALVFRLGFVLLGVAAIERDDWIDVSPVVSIAIILVCIGAIRPGSR